MKLNHVAAFALIGWYLLIPPVDTQSGRAASSAPLSDWLIHADYFFYIHSREKCEKERADIAPAMSVFKDQVNKSGSVEEKALREQVLQAQCAELNDNDPRVREWRAMP